jgi:ornithine cyclodeaminase/alanine dehydrogenase-like protein (mu-crystallin family)
VTARRTGAAAVLAAEPLGRADASTAAVIGAGVNGVAAAETFVARGRDVLLWDVDEARARTAAKSVGGRVATSREEALAADLLVTVTPGHEVLLPAGSLRPGQHVSLMGADGPGKAEIAVDELARVRVFCDGWEQPRSEMTADPNARVRLFADDWEQASHNGELAHAVRAGSITREDVTQLGAVLARTAPGRQAPADITIFDSTGLAIQDLAIALAAMEDAAELDLPTLEL